MSTRLFDDDVIFLQRLLKCAGLYSGKIDGIWGKNTDTAVDAFENNFTTIAGTLGTFDAGSERRIHTLLPKAQELARRCLKAIRDANINARIISGTRTYAEQNVIFSKGRFGDASPKVTNSRGGQSNHNFGIAWDIGIFSDDGKYLPESPKYNQAGQAAAAAGIVHLEWGGNWKTFVDRPHYQHATGLLIGDVRSRFENGQSYI